MKTIDTIRKNIESSIEDTETPKRILAFLAQHSGKRISQRHVDALEKLLGMRVRLVRESWKTALDINGRGLSEPNRKHLGCHGPSWDISVGPGGNLPTIPEADEIKKLNPAYFEAAEQRNTERARLLKNEKLLQQLADAVDMSNDVTRRLRTLLDKDEVDVARYDVKSLVTEEL
jgi:hypothetical protein